VRKRVGDARRSKVVEGIEAMPGERVKVAQRKEARSGGDKDG
jgi:hypothetical protein